MTPEMGHSQAEFRGCIDPDLWKLFKTGNPLNSETLLCKLPSALGNFGGIRWLGVDTVAVLTDCSGSIPIFYGEYRNRLAVGWSPLEVADKLGTRAIDPVSAGDFLANGTVCYPFTIFKHVYAAPPGSISVISVGKVESKTYYLPGEEENQGTAEDWGGYLRQNVRYALRFGLEGCDKVNVLYSGGEDARAVAAQLPENMDCELIVLADAHNREVRLAKRSARLLGWPVKFVCRPSGFYRDKLEERVRAVGGNWDVRHAHVFGATAEPIKTAGALVGGYMADALFKTAWMGNVTSRLRPWPESLRRGYPSFPMGIRRASDLDWMRPEMIAGVLERRMKHHARIQEFRPVSAANWQTKWPLGTQPPAYAYHLACRGIGPPVVEPFIDNQVYRVAAAMPDQFRVDGKAFRAAFAGSLGRTGWQPTSSGRIARLSGFSGHWIAVAVQGRRKLWDLCVKTLWSAHRTTCQGAWSADHWSFEFHAADYLAPDRMDMLSEFLDPVVSGRIQCGGPGPTLNNLPCAERLRAVQIGLLAGD